MLDAQLLLHIKTKPFAAELKAWADKFEGHTQMNIYQILATIMTESDIKSELVNPTEIASLLVNELQKIIGNKPSKERVKNLLKSLKCKSNTFLSPIDVILFREDI